MYINKHNLSIWCISIFLDPRSAAVPELHAQARRAHSSPARQAWGVPMVTGDSRIHHFQEPLDPP